MSDKQKALDLALTQIERQFGRLGEAWKLQQVKWKSSQPAPCPWTWPGVGAYRGDRLLKYSGLNHPAKQLSPSTYRRITKMGGIAALSTRNTLDPVYARNLGVDIENLLVSQPIPVSKPWKLQKPQAAEQ